MDNLQGELRVNLSKFFFELQLKVEGIQGGNILKLFSFR